MLYGLVNTTTHRTPMGKSKYRHYDYQDSDHEYIEINEEEFSSSSESDSLEKTERYSKSKGKARENVRAPPKKKIELQKPKKAVSAHLYKLQLVNGHSDQI